MDQQKTVDLLARLAAARTAGDTRGVANAFDAGMASGTPVPGLARAALDCLADDRSAIRNSGAIALVDMKCPEAAPAIRAALMRAGVAAQSGTLIYALVEIGGSITLAEAAHLAAEGSYEARGELVELMREDRLDVTDKASIAEVRERLVDMTHDECDDAGNAASEVLAALGRQGISHRHGLTA